MNIPPPRARTHPPVAGKAHSGAAPSFVPPVGCVLRTTLQIVAVAK
jgi:hypothetical protein